MNGDDRRFFATADVTLNGRPAYISNFRCEFARVVDAETGLSAEWSWEAVKRVVDNGGEFRS